MEQSLYLAEVDKWFAPRAARVINKLNNTTNPNAITYLHRQMLTKDFSTDLRWASVIGVNNTIVAADVVAMDSSLPLKIRDKITSANGEIPKIGMEMAMREKDLHELRQLRNNPNQVKVFLQRLFADTEKVINGVLEQLELQFLLGLSTGVAVVNDAINVGTGIRVDYGYLTANKFGVSKVWSDPTSTPFTDLSNRVLAKASEDGNAVSIIMLDRTTFNNIAKTAEAKDLFAASVGFLGAGVPIPSLAQINAATRDRYGFVFQIVDRTIRVEKNGIQTPIKPWAAGAVVCLTNPNVGTLTYGTLAEMDYPVNNVNYTTVDDYILVSKFRLNRPSLSEHTTSQAFALPVINGVDGIYLMDSTTVQA